MKRHRPVKSALLLDVEKFIARWRLADTQFGAMAVRSTQLVHRLRKGSRPRPETEERIRAFMAKGDPRGGYVRRHSRFAQKYTETVRRNAEQAKADEAFRATDQTEQAKKFLRTRGWTVFNAEILRPAEIGKFFIGTMLVDRGELLRRARKEGWR